MKVWIFCLFTMIGLLPASRALALAVSVPGEPASAWHFNDLTHASHLRILVSGADATLVNSADNVLTIEIFNTLHNGKLPELKDDAAAWKAIVIGNKLHGKGSVRNQHTFAVGSEWRYYVEIQTDTAGGSPIYSSVMAAVRDGRVVIFAFQQDKELFFPHLAAVKKLYRQLKIDHI